MSHLDMRVVASQLHSCPATVEIWVPRLRGASPSKAQCDWPMKRLNMPDVKLFPVGEQLFGNQHDGQHTVYIID